MREIKFRAWTNRCWVNDGMVYDYEKTVYVEDFGFDSEEMPIMQYTGLKDKHGKEIYEGDIVVGYLGWVGGYRKKSLPKRVNVICEIAFREGKFQSFKRGPVDEHREAYATNNYRSVNYALRTYGSESGICPTLEVIGNIYENPELLEQPDAN